MPTRSWVIAAAVGALAGMTLMTPFSLLLFGQREFGLGVGGILGAAALVALVGALARNPQVRSVVAHVLALSTQGHSLGVSGRTGAKAPPAGYVARWAASLLLLLTRPRMESAVDPAQLRKMLQAHLEHAADLVLAWCWAHPGRVPAETTPLPPPPPLPGAVCDALAELYTDLSAGASPEGLREMVEVLFQRFEDHGYVWTAVRTGTPFEEAMREQFEVLGRPAPGEPVRTRRASLRVGEKVERKGELRRA